MSRERETGRTGRARSNLNIGGGALGDDVGEEGVERLNLGPAEGCRVFAEQDGAEGHLGNGELMIRHDVRSTEAHVGATESRWSCLGSRKRGC